MSGRTLEQEREAFRKAYWERLNKPDETGVPPFVRNTINGFLVKQRREVVLPMGMPVLHIDTQGSKFRRLNMISG